MKKGAKTITKDMIIIDVLKMDPNCADIFLQNGMYCIGCPHSSGESIQAAASAHGVDPDVLVKALNEYFAQ
jgi:hybrid cluster-associated redox disulfide protein